MQWLVAVGVPVVAVALFWWLASSWVDAAVLEERRACEATARTTPLGGRRVGERAESDRMRRRVAGRIAARGAAVEEPALQTLRARLEARRAHSQPNISA